MSESYTQAEFLRDYDAALRGYTVTGYPRYDERLRLTSADELYAPDGQLTLPYDASAPWCPADFYPSHSTKPQIPEQFIDRGGNYPPTPTEATLWEEFGVRQDQRHMPVHPFTEAILLGGTTPEGDFVQPGGVVTPGYYYRRGPQKTADMLLLAPDGGQLHGLFVERKDSGLLAIPGGHVEAEDTADSHNTYPHLNEYEIAGIRELSEEAGVNVDLTTLTCSGLTVALTKVWAGPGADQRATLHSWPQGEAFIGVLPELPAQRPLASTDAKTAAWRPLSEETLRHLARFSSHGTIGRRAVAAYERTTNARVDQDGSITMQAH